MAILNPASISLAFRHKKPGKALCVRICLFVSRLCEAIGVVGRDVLGRGRTGTPAGQFNRDRRAEIIPRGFDLIARKPGITGMHRDLDRRRKTPPLPSAPCRLSQPASTRQSAFTPWL